MSFETLQSILEQRSAASTAELMLSPFVHEKIILEAIADEGPSLWLVNRSDVYTESLEVLKKHPVQGVAERARQKLLLRSSGLSTPLPDPKAYENLGGVSRNEIEDHLGHPHVNLEVIEFFFGHTSEDVRASAALSFCRKLLECPDRPEMQSSILETLIQKSRELLLSDPSAYVRGYIARLPVLGSEVLATAGAREDHGLVLLRVAQNPDCSLEILEGLSTRLSVDTYDADFAAGLAMDRRLSTAIRKKLSATAETLEDRLSLTIHRNLL